MKIGRNDPCHCGSGNKYKKCCLEKDKSMKRIEDVLSKEKLIDPVVNDWMKYEEVNGFSTDEIIQKLKDIGIPFNKESFLRDVETFFSAQEVSENWFSQYKVNAPGRMEDFPWLAACVLWERLAPSENLSMEQLSDHIEEGYDALKNDDPIIACDTWLQVWDVITYRINPLCKTLDYLDKHYRRSFFIRNFVQDLELTLDQAGQKDSTYYEKRIAFCRSFCRYFPEEDLIYHNMRRAIAESYSKLGRYSQAELEFEQLIADVPDNPWGYIGLADMLMLDKKEEYSRAELLLEKALPLAEVHPYGDTSAIKDRLESLKK